MKFDALRLVCISGWLVLGCTACSAPAGDLSLDTDVGAWQYSKQKMIPKYPAQSISASHQGVAVVWVNLTDTGKVTDATVLQAPDQMIADSSLEAARSTTFAIPVLQGKRYRGHGKLYYYFRLAPQPHVDIPN
jgi:TonB family protein